MTSILVTHDLESAFGLSDRLAMIDDGEIIKVGTPEEFRASTDPRVVNFVRGKATKTEELRSLLAG